MRDLVHTFVWNTYNHYSLSTSASAFNQMAARSQDSFHQHACMHTYWSRGWSWRIRNYVARHMHRVCVCKLLPVPPLPHMWRRYSKIVHALIEQFRRRPDHKYIFIPHTYANYTLHNIDIHTHASTHVLGMRA